jgi:hypothetical protein
MIDGMCRLLPIVVLVFTGCAGSPPEKPPMSSVLQKIVQHPASKPARPATEEAIAKVAAHYKRKLPEPLLELWQNADGIEFTNRFYGKLLGPTEVLELLENPVWFDFAKFQMLPIFDSLESDYHVLSMDELLAYRIMFTPHDDGPNLAYRDLNSFLVDLYAGLSSAEMNSIHFRQCEGDYSDDKPRTTADQADALALLAQPEGDYNWNYAIQLLDDSDLKPWKKLLETNHFIRRYARGRLSEMASPRMKELYQQDQREFAAFCDQLEKAAKAAGLPVGERDRKCLDVGGHWIDLDGLFHLRNEPRAIERMLNLCRDFIDDRDPRERPDYIFKKKSN